jgi:hypothetical protein
LTADVPRGVKSILLQKNVSLTGTSSAFWKNSSWLNAFSNGSSYAMTAPVRSLIKVLSSEIDQAKGGLIRQLFIEGRGAEIFS